MPTTANPDTAVPGAAPFKHLAFLYAGEQELVRGLVPFLVEGVSAGDPVMVALPGRKLEAVRDALTPGVRTDVTFVDMLDIGRNPAAIIPVWQAFVDEQPADVYPQGVGEPAWPGRTEAELDECARHEALLNVAFSSRAWTLLCPYDVEGLPDFALSNAHRTHGIVADAAGSRPSADYGHEWPQLDDELPLPGPGMEELAFEVGSLRVARSFVAERAAASGLSPARIDDLVLAVSELCTNSVTHGGGGGVVRVWRDRDALVCEVTDSGTITDPLTGRCRPSPEQDGGRGLWLANRICDLVRLRSGPNGTRTRLHIEVA